MKDFFQSAVKASISLLKLNNPMFSKSEFLKSKERFSHKMYQYKN